MVSTEGVCVIFSNPVADRIPSICALLDTIFTLGCTPLHLLLNGKGIGFLALFLDMKKDAIAPTILKLSAFSPPSPCNRITKTVANRKEQGLTGL